MTAYFSPCTEKCRSPVGEVRVADDGHGLPFEGIATAFEVSAARRLQRGIREPIMKSAGQTAVARDAAREAAILRFWRTVELFGPRAVPAVRLHDDTRPSG